MTGWLIAHAAVTWFLAGLIWTVHVVHYPLFAAVGPERFPAYHADHARRIGWLVLPLMPLELLLAAGIALSPTSPVSAPWAWTGLALACGVWGSTALLQVPEHRRLAGAFRPAAHRRLVRGNVVRTALWTLRAVLAAAFLVPVLAA